MCCSTLACSMRVSTGVTDCPELSLAECIDDGLETTLGGRLPSASSSNVYHSDQGASASAMSWPHSLWSSEALVVTESIVSKEVCRRRWGGSLLVLLISLLLLRYETSPRAWRRAVGGWTTGAGSGDGPWPASTCRNKHEDLRVRVGCGGGSTGCNRSGFTVGERGG